MGKIIFKKTIAIIIILIFVTTNFLTIICGYNVESNEKLEKNIQKISKNQDYLKVKFYSFGLKDQLIKEIIMPHQDVEELFEKILLYSNEYAIDSRSDETKKLQQEIFTYADQQGMLPECISEKTEYSHLMKLQNSKTINTPVLDSRGSAFFCNFITTGTGSQFPIIIFPRLIPILQLPIPRLFLMWSAVEGVTSCGGLLTGKGYIAGGRQSGLALGFWGIGFSVFLPPIMQYGFLGYALFATTQAEEIELWPPNNPPSISPINPSDGEIDIPISLTELSFQISDIDGDLMSYTVTTTPDIGSGNKDLCKDGTYSVPVSGLDGNTDYIWHIVVDDGEDSTVKDFSFTTEKVTPIVTDPIPINGARHVSVDQEYLEFKLIDYQGDFMDYTVETSPNIGSGGENGVVDGPYSIPVSGLEFDTEYTWYVNVTDGENWNYKKLNFKTILSPGPWWDESWTYRKYLGIIDTESDCQIKIKVWKEDGYDEENGIIDCENHCNDNFSDLRFVTYNGIQCNYWIEEIGIENDDQYAIIWTKIPSSNDEVLYLYYGNPDASDESNGENTFIFFDDFENNNLNKWYNVDNAWSVQSSIVKYGTYAAYGYDGASGNGGQLRNNSNNKSSYILEEWVRFGETNKYHYPVYPSGCCSGGCDRKSFYLLSARDNGHWGYFNGNWPYKNFPNDLTYTSNTWYHVKFMFDASVQKYWVWIDDYDLTGPSGLPLKCSNGNLLPPDGKLNLRLLVGSGTQTGADFWLDNYFTRKYCNPEPFWESFGEEEQII